MCSARAGFVLLLMLLARVGCGQRPDHGLYCRPREPKAWKNAPLSTVYSNPDSILTILLFYAPKLSGTQLMVYAAVTYVTWGMIYTASDVPFGVCRM